MLDGVSEEIRTQRFGSPWERATDLAACGAGLAVAGLGAVLHLKAGGREEPVLEFLRALGGVSLAAAPALLFGALAGAFLATRTRSFRWDAFLLALVLLGPAAAAVLAVLLGLQPRFAPPPAPRPPPDFLHTPPRRP